MTTMDKAIYSIANAFGAKNTAEGVSVMTHYIYPSSSFVRVFVRGGEQEFSVSDDGGALMEVEAAGLDTSQYGPQKLARTVLANSGLKFEKGVVRSPFVDVDALPVYVALVAKASQELTAAFYKHARLQYVRDIKKLVGQMLTETFKSQLKHKVEIIGESNKAHKFENVVSLSDGRRLIVDPVLRDAASINARVVANMDVRNAKYDDLEQRIIYDDQADWHPEDINLLRAGATVVPFSGSPAVIRRIAATA